MDLCDHSFKLLTYLSLKHSESCLPKTISLEWTALYRLLLFLPLTVRLGYLNSKKHIFIFTLIHCIG